MKMSAIVPVVSKKSPVICVDPNSAPKTYRCSEEFSPERNTRLNEGRKHCLTLKGTNQCFFITLSIGVPTVARSKRR